MTVALLPHRAQPVGRDRLTLASHIERWQLLRFDRVTHEIERRATEEDLARRCRLLQARGEVDSVPGHETLLRTRDHLARVDADPQLERYPVIASELLVQCDERLVQPCGRPHRTQRIVLVHHRHAEHSHHRVADELLHHPAVRFDRHAGHLEVAGHHVAQALRVEPLAKCGGVGHVAEEDRDGLSHLSPGCVDRDRRATRSAEASRVLALVSAARAGRHNMRLERRPMRRKERCCRQRTCVTSSQRESR